MTIIDKTSIIKKKKGEILVQDKSRRMGAVAMMLDATPIEIGAEPVSLDMRRWFAKHPS
jgi:hypothetical protein